MGLCHEKAEPSRSAGGRAAGRRGLGVSREGGGFRRCRRQSRREEGAVGPLSREGGAFPRCRRHSRGEKGIGRVPRRRSLPAVRAAQPREEEVWAFVPRRRSVPAVRAAEPR